MRNSIFILSLFMLIYSCGKEVASALASNPSNTTTAPWRMTRTEIMSNATITEKDQLCLSEFGADYVAGSDLEAYSLAKRTNYIVYIVVANLSYLLLSANNTNTGPLFCIHK